PDLRGYGDSVGPDDAGPNNINYSFRAMAQDQVEVMEQLGYREFFVAGHDRGARTTARMCLDHPDRVKRAALVDILPNHHILTHTSQEWTLRSWHRARLFRPGGLRRIRPLLQLEDDQGLLRRLPRLPDLRFRHGQGRFRGRP